MVLVVFLPSPACGRGAGGESRRWHTDALYFVEAPALSPTPLPQAGEGSDCGRWWQAPAFSHTAGDRACRHVPTPLISPSPA
ncbi:hypothetical protein CBM2589_A20157 [Cupriavidus taiwanensis]|uniref:Uncharacterized protein n=1 Tax=Cupriavidus taiwanensis TaxID=164546 RepID=A0A375C0T8_9BURK|nr:hypothetical protein CBM2589_A20157 [Cupriavidus taiwanensis]